MQEFESIIAATATSLKAWQKSSGLLLSARERRIVKAASLIGSRRTAKVRAELANAFSLIPSI